MDIDDYNNEVARMLESSESYILKFIASRLIQFNLYGNHEVHQIFNTVYLRGIKNIEEQGNLCDREPCVLESWFRGTVVNVIRENRRENSRHQNPPRGCFERDFIENILENINYCTKENVERLRNKLGKLKKLDLQILRERVFEKKSWEQIFNSLRNQLEEDGIHKVSSLRQRYRRILRFLKQGMEGG